MQLGTGRHPTMSSWIFEPVGLHLEQHLRAAHHTWAAPHCVDRNMLEHWKVYKCKTCPEHQWLQTSMCARPA
eukprot:7704091-Alexandrium_andersonii.AAC.1